MTNNELTVEELDFIEKCIQPYAWELGRLIVYTMTGKDINELMEDS